MSSYDNAELLALWLEDNLTPEQRTIFEQRCVQDDDFAQQVEAASTIKLHADGYQDFDVPQWDRDKTFDCQERGSSQERANSQERVDSRNPFEYSARRQRWAWLPSVSFAMSALAIVLVLTGTQVSLTSGELRIRFGHEQSQLAMSKLIDSKLDTFKQNQQEAFSLYAQTLQQQQLESASQLTNYLLTSSRKERREDFAELIKFVNQQRSDDQLFYARQLNQLQQDVYLDANGIKVDSTQQ
ncbi:hypothetical protein [Paraglaciecola chathamensis]|uniref:Uncharacterized protein n=1 Tax=Paraglaciecola chathamensis TaxID=368405 RepID=A0A8H9M2E6_9ALTE|nr:hypothetical protein [Paraglaciecola oceanifecundans]GGZ46723.1 hypothetical protein GCM10011274_00320 [Paraglaciecola oceanifecundans]